MIRGGDFEIKCWWDTLRFYPTIQQHSPRKSTENSAQLDRCPVGGRTGDLPKESGMGFPCNKPTKKMLVGYTEVLSHYSTTLTEEKHGKVSST